MVYTSVLQPTIYFSGTTANSITMSLPYHTTTPTTASEWHVVEPTGEPTGVATWVWESTNHTMGRWERKVYSSGTATATWGFYDGTTLNWDVQSGPVFYPPKSRKEMLREIIHNRVFPGIRASRLPLLSTADQREIRARETLRRVIGDKKFMLYIKHGFISVRSPKSGLTYQIYPGHDFTRVYKNGNMIERLCVVLSGRFPPTDSLITRYLMILNDEAHFRNLAVKHSIFNTTRTPPVRDPRSLAEIAKQAYPAAVA